MPRTTPLRTAARTAATLLALLLASIVGATASASPLLDGTVYELANHPDGAVATPFYGLRLDGLLGDATEEWTFDFEHASSAMLLVWNAGAATIDIYGQSFGGEDVGAAYDPGTTSIWAISFHYDNVQDLGASLLVDNVGGPHGSGTIANTSTNTGLATLESYMLVDVGMPDTFHIAAGHRGFAGLSGWGWMNHGKDEQSLTTHIESSDWLFTIGGEHRVPEPTVAAMLMGGLLLAGFTGRRR